MANAPTYTDSQGQIRSAEGVVLIGTDGQPYEAGAGGGGSADSTAENQVLQLAQETAAAGALGTTAGAAVVTDANGTIQQYLRGLVKRWADALGAGTKAAALRVDIATDNAIIGATNETAPATDTASSGLNGRLQRIAQRLTSMIALMPVGAATATLTNVASSASTGTVLASNANRLGCIITNDDANPVYIKFGATASATSYTLVIPSGGTYTMPRGELYTGIIDGIWAADGSGSARVTELTA